MLHTLCVTAQNAGSPAVHEPALFGKTCAVCHGGGGEGTDRAPALTNNRELRGASEKEIAELIRNGRGNMPAFSLLPAEQIQELAHFIHSMNADAFEMRPAGDEPRGPASFMAMAAAPRVTRRRDAGAPTVLTYPVSDGRLRHRNSNNRCASRTRVSPQATQSSRSRCETALRYAGLPAARVRTIYSYRPLTDNCTCCSKMNTSTCFRKNDRSCPRSMARRSSTSTWSHS